VKTVEKKSIRRGYRDISRINKSILPVTVLSNILSATTPIINIIAPAKLVDWLSEGKELRSIVLLVGLTLLLNYVFWVLENWLEAKLDSSWDILGNYEKNSISKKLLKVEYERLESSEFNKKIMQHREEELMDGSLFSDLNWIVMTIASSIMRVGTAVFLLWGFWKIMFAATGTDFINSSWLSIIVILVTLIVGGGTALMSGKIHTKSVELREKYASTNQSFAFYKNLVADYKMGKEIRLYKAQNYIIKKAIGTLFTEGMELQKRISKNNALSNGISTILFSLLAFGVYLIIGVKTRAGLCSIGDMIIYIGGFIQLLSAINNFTLMLGRLKSIAPRACLYYEILDAGSNESKTKLLTVPKQVNQIRLNNVYYSYPNSNFSIKNLNIAINQGDRIAVVGENGSGKTTFIKLLCGLMYSTHGEILLNGTNIKELNQEEYWGLFSVVFQDYHIFSLPLGENIAANAEVNFGRVEDCIGLAGLSSWVSKLQNGLETFMYKDCNVEGVEISGGEAQKIALARALYKDTPIMILDEPTSAIDPVAENELYTRFNDLVKDKIAIYISHRLSSCKFCNKIAVFEDGMLAQYGTHDELISDKSSKYYELWNAQAQYYI